jgi:hypothetical protein
MSLFAKHLDQWYSTCDTRKHRTVYVKIEKNIVMNTE